MTGKTHVAAFIDEADIQAHMLTPEDHGGKAIYGLNTHRYDFSPEAERQFWDWHFRREAEQHEQALAEYQAKQDDLNRLIMERRLALHAARPEIEICAGPKTYDAETGMVRVRCTAGDGPGPIRYYWVGFRETWRRGEANGGWSKWRTDFRPWNLPYETTLQLDPSKEYDVAVIGGYRYGRVESIPVRVTFVPESKMETGTAQETIVQDPPGDPNVPPAHAHTFSGVWGHAWNQFPGIAPGRKYGSISGAAFSLPNGNPGLVTAVFRHRPGKLRLTLAKGTPADQFPDEIRVSGGIVFDDPGPVQKFGLGDARDYEIETGLPDKIKVGETSTLVLEWDEPE